MKKYLLPILIPSIFVAFITYATIETKPASIDIQGQEEVVLVEDIQSDEAVKLPESTTSVSSFDFVQPNSASKNVEDKKVDASLAPFVATPVVSIEKKNEPEVVKKYYDDEDDEEDSGDRDEDDD